MTTASAGIYSFTEKHGGQLIEFMDANTAAEAFHLADPDGQPLMVYSIGNSASIIAGTVKYGDDPRSKSVSHSVIDNGIFCRAYLVRGVNGD